MENIEKLIARATAWLENAEETRTTRWVQTIVEDLQNGEDIDAREISMLKDAVKGTRVSLTLSEEQQQQVFADTETLLEVFTRYPTLAVPRERTEDNFIAALEKAMKENIKAGGEE